MKKQTVFALLAILVLTLSACGTPPPAAPTTPTLLPTQQTVIPTDITYPTFTPAHVATAILYSTLTPIQTEPIQTEIPYPTASVVNANAVAFIERDNENHLSLWVAKVDGSGERKLVELTPNRSWVYDQILQWSPDGKWISYYSKDDLWIVSPDGLTNKKVLSFPDLYIHIWSPDSSKIAYIQKATYGPVAQITVGMLDLVTEKVLEISSHQAPDPMPLSWSPDGKYILFTKDFSYSLYEVDTGKIVEEIEPGGMDMGCWVNWNLWSPNSKWFFYTQHGNGSYNMWICLSGLNGTTWRIEDVGVVVSPPVWDKNGKFLYFVVGEINLDVSPNIYTNQRLMRYDVETQKKETVLSLEEAGPTGFIWSVTLSPNGRMLGLYSYTYREDNKSRLKQNKIFILDIDSLSIAKYTLELKGEVDEYYPSPTWSPDSQNIIFLSETNGCFYKFDVRTGKETMISGKHSVEYWVASPVATTP